jgi:hypothetical protein
MSESMPKGNQLWCVKDNRSYQTLVSRWKTNPVLKAWWKKLAPHQQRDWFLKWQSMTPKERFQHITYAEAYEDAHEDIEDEIEKFIPFGTYEEKYIRTLTPDVILQNWLDIIEENQSECKYRRGQWLIPEYKGIERRVRSRRTEQISTTRTADIEDDNQLLSHLAAGRSRLARLREQAPQSVIPARNTGPIATSRPTDQPQRPEPQGLLVDTIHREVLSIVIPHNVLIPLTRFHLF